MLLLIDFYNEFGFDTHGKRVIKLPEIEATSLASEMVQSNTLEGRFKKWFNETFETFEKLRWRDENDQPTYQYAPVKFKEDVYLMYRDLKLNAAEQKMIGPKDILDILVRMGVKVQLVNNKNPVWNCASAVFATKRF